MWLLFLFPVFPAGAQQRPLRTDDAALLAAGRVRAEFGIEFMQGQKYPLSGLVGDLTRVGATGFQVGVGEYAEFQISGVFQDFLSVTRQGQAVIPPNFLGNATSDFGDLVLATKLKLLSDSAWRPGMAFKFAVQLPMATNESGLGTDETEFFASLLLAKQLGRVRLLGSLGLAIMGSPVEPNTQADKITYGAGMILRMHPRINLAAEITGREGPERVGNENQRLARLGLQFISGGFRWDVAGIAGFKHHDPDTGLAVGVTYEFQAFNKSGKPKTIK